MAPKKSGGGGGGQKKKKAVVSNRGFATVSVPKKVIVVPEDESTHDELAETGMGENGTAVEVDGVNRNKEGVNGGGGGKDEWDVEGMEKHELKMLAEKIRPGADKEVARVNKVSSRRVLFAFKCSPD